MRESCHTAHDCLADCSFCDGLVLAPEVEPLFSLFTRRKRYYLLLTMRLNYISINLPPVGRPYDTEPQLVRAQPKTTIPLL